MSTPTITKREEVVFEGIRSYFFPSLLLHITANEDNILDNGTLNPFAAYILGLKNVKPSTNEIIEMIVSQEDLDRLHTALDALFLLGKTYEPQIKSIGNDLVKRGGAHDVYELYSSAENWEKFEKNLSGFVRKMVIRKCDAKYLSYILKIGSAKNEVDKFNAISELCIENLEWDAFVLIKLLGLETEERKEEIELIRDNVLESLRTCRPQLADLIQSGPKNDVIYLLNHKFPNSLNDINKIIFEKINPLLNQNDEISVEDRCKYLSELFYVIFKISLTQQFDFATNYIEQLPEHLRSEMFNDLDLVVFETTFHLLNSFIWLFSSDNNAHKTEYSSAVASGLYKHLSSYWKRQAMLRILSNFYASITQSNLGVLIPLVNDTNLCSNIEDVLKFLIWFIGSFENEDKEYHNLNILPVETKSKLITYFKNMKKKAEPSVEHIYRVCNALEKSNADITILTKAQTPETPMNDGSLASEDENADTNGSDCESPVNPNEQTMIAVPQKYASSTYEEELKGDLSPGQRRTSVESVMSRMSLDGWEDFPSPSRVHHAKQVTWQSCTTKYTEFFDEKGQMVFD
ncbi:unnamed protein product [Caenorhabditis angaria]|uniref:Uncharacterized protein n=1 Tax=Caenorhabditis angaria TaxID=860376 RepID=A0A9P1MU49_9PELO|nr:unnamed protein product [Caenorhabditis angaria]